MGNTIGIGGASAGLQQFVIGKRGNSPTLLETSRPYGIETSRRGDTAAFFVETRVSATTSADVSRRLCLTRSRARLPPTAAKSPAEPQSLELSVARRVSG